MVASANWVPSSLGGRGLVPPCCGDHHDDEDKLLLPTNAPNQQHQQHHHQAVPPFAGDLLHIDADDSDEEMEPFDAERFVDRLVEDDPSPWRCDGGGQGQAADLWEAPGVDPGMGMMTGHSSRSTAAAAKLFLQPISSWPLAPQPQLPQPQQTLPLDVAPAHSVFEEGSRGLPIVVPHDPILDALFTPARATSPEIVPTVTDYGLVGVAAAALQQQQQLGGESSTITRNDAVVTRFHPPAVYNITTPVDFFPSAVRIPMAPLPLKHDDCVSFGGGFCLLGSPSRAKIIFGSEEQGLPPHHFQQQQQQQQLQQQQQQQQEQQQQEQQHQHQQPVPFAAVRQQEIPSKLFCSASVTTTTAAASSVTISSAAGTIAAATRAASTSAAAAVAAPAHPQLTGADGFSDEYDDEQHAFLRRQEVALFVGPGYLAGPGRPGLVTPADRTSVVAWLCEVHAAAPVASFDGVGGGGGGGGVAGGSGGGSGSAPLSLDSLFLAVNLLDRFLSTAEGARTSFAGAAALRVAAAAALALASKYEDTQAATLWGVAAASALANSASCYCFPGGGGDSGDCCCSCGGGGGIGGGGSVAGGGGDVRAARKELAAMELRVVSALGFRLTVPTALSFLGVFMRRADALGYLARGAGAERVREEAQQILLCVLRDACSLEHPPSALAASALYWASCVTAPSAAPPASFSFFAVTGYQLERLCRCLRDMESVRTGGGGSHPPSVGGGGGIGGGGDWAGASFPAHAERSLFDAGGGHPAIAAFSLGGH